MAQEDFAPCSGSFAHRIFASNPMRIPPPRKIRLIVNPVAGRGRAQRRLPRITRAFAAERIIEVVATERSGDEARLAAEAMSDGIETIVAVGGDGTCARIANALISGGSSCRLAVVPVGTGNDFAKTVGLAKMGYGAIAKLCVGTSIARMDVGKVDDLYFLNGCGFGIDPEILAATLDVIWLRGSAVYVVTALRKLFSYAGVEITDSAMKERLMMLTVSNGRSLGGAFPIAPQASVCDGVLDVHRFRDAPARRRLAVFLGALKGTHPKLPEVAFEQRESLELGFDSAPPMEVDGELRRAANQVVKIDCIAGALSVVAAPGFPL
jgi:diacylglycerol kinase (ATP)